MSKWEEEKRLMHTIKYRAPIKFTATILLPQAGSFALPELYHKDPHGYIQRWVEGAVSNIYTGPLVTVIGPHTGAVLNNPIIRVQHHPHFTQAISKWFGRK